MPFKLKTKLIPLIVAFNLIIPTLALAVANIYTVEQGGQTIPVCYEGFVPCGKSVSIFPAETPEGEMIKSGKCETTNATSKLIHCQLCHFFVMFNGIVKYVLFSIIPPLAVFFLVLGGVFFYFSAGKPESLRRAKSLIQGVIIGLGLIYGAYLIVGTFLWVLGVTQWTGLANWAHLGPFSITCPIVIK